jgi:hypothetical protein
MEEAERLLARDPAHWLFGQTVSLLALVLAIDNETAEPFV